MRKLKPGFFSRSTPAVARQLLGKYLVRRSNGRVISGRIVETEAYRGKDDPGSHAFRRRTPRNGGSRCPMAACTATCARAIATSEKGRAASASSAKMKAAA